jgi:hypothetical protein
VIDIPEAMASVLQQHVAGTAGYLFSTKDGKPLQQRNVLRVLHAAGKKVGSHVFRRFRTETLRRARVPEDLISLWEGRAKQSVTDLYALGLHRDEAWRREWCEKTGLGFSLLGLLGLQNGKEADAAKAA